ncbi:Protein dachsous [Hypsibius exemplaris]|uniref:Protein dachsous n=1 Tax=Hypsibius exemplaris TaxID=2072580 RepID=A0A1W0WCT1_HYPEX|nr:Protein dachsous [Hypsibius exemplaris]
MKHLWRFFPSPRSWRPHFLIASLLLLAPHGCRGDIIQDLTADEGTLPGQLIGRIDAPSSRFPADTIPKPPYIIMSYQESVERDLAINENTGEIHAKVALDRELTDFYSFMAVPLLGGANIRVKLAVHDVNDHSPVFREPSVSIEFSESQPRDTRRSLPPATDLDVGINTTQRYEIVSGNVNNVFRLSSRRGRDGVLYLDLEINGVLDRETVEGYDLVVEAYDGGQPLPRSGRLTVNVTLLDDNDNQPLFTESRYYATVLENTTIGTTLLKVQATDADAGRNAQIAYSINRRVTDADHVFDIDSGTGVVSLSKNLDYEKRATYELVITARDNGSQPLESATFVYIEVQNVNDRAPQIDIAFLHNGTGNVSEASAIGDAVARLSVSDEDSSGDGKIIIKMTGDMDKFELVPDASSDVYMLRVKGRLDYEERDNFSLIVVASDGGQPAPLVTERVVTILLLDANDNVPVFDKPVYGVDVGESVENGTVLVLATATDADAGDNARVEYFLPSPGTGKIRIDGKTGVVTAAITWDCQGEHSERIIIAARDHGLPSLTSTAVVQLNFRSDSDVAPVFEKAFYNVSLGAEDVLTVGNCFLKVRYDVRTGVVSLSKNLDYEKRATYELVITARDNGSQPLESATFVYIEVQNVNDRAPQIDIAFSTTGPGTCRKPARSAMPLLVSPSAMRTPAETEKSFLK